MVHIGIGIPSCLDDEGVGGDGEGVKDGSHGFALVLAGIVPGDGFAGLDGFDDITMGVIAVVALVVTVVDYLHGDANSDHIAGSIACRITAAVTAITDLGAGAAAVIVTGGTGREHHDSLGRFFLGSFRIRDGFCFGFGWRFSCFHRLSFGNFRRSGTGRFTGRLSFLILRGECRYRAQREAGKSQREYKQKRQRFLHYIQSISSFLWKWKKRPLMRAFLQLTRGHYQVCLMVLVLRNDGIPIRHRRACLRSTRPYIRNRHGRTGIPLPGRMRSGHSTGRPVRRDLHTPSSRSRT